MEKGNEKGDEEEEEEEEEETIDVMNVGDDCMKGTLSQ